MNTLPSGTFDIRYHDRTRQLLILGHLVPVSVEPRQLGALGALGGVTSLASSLGQLGKQVPPTVDRAGKSLDPNKKKDDPADPKSKKGTNPLSSLTGALGGLGLPGLG